MPFNLRWKESPKTSIQMSQVKPSLSLGFGDFFIVIWGGMEERLTF